VSRSIGLISFCFEVVVAFLICEEVADGTDGLPEGVIGAGGGFPDQAVKIIS
jgi:hypothetical protein